MPPSSERRTESVHIDAVASGEARMYVAGRDLVQNFYDGVRSRRRVRQGSAADECPYPGLDGFGREQARWFFGRDRLIADLVDRLDRRRRSGGPQMVVAPSGAGKSSLLRAGLLPSLEDGALPGSAHWPQAMFTPTATPLHELAAQVGAVIADLTGAEPDQVIAELAADPRRAVGSLSQALRTGESDAGRRAVIVVDQFEELFTLCDAESQRVAFIDLLTQLAAPPAADTGGPADPVASVVIGLRADFYPACANHPQLRAALQHNQLVVGAMSQDELREAIRFPAQDVGLDIEEGLVEILLRDLGAATGDEGALVYEAGQLPLLAHALRRSWQRRHGATLTVAGYQSTGGIQGAIAATAEEAFDGLTAAEPAMARLLFLRLIRVGDRTDDTRRRPTRAELMEATTDQRAMAAVIDAFTRERLLTQHRDTVEITHEALLRTWPRLRTWINDDRTGHLINQQLDEAAHAWKRGNRDPSLLYRGARLQTTRDWADAPLHDDLSPLIREFLAASTGQQRRSQRLRTSAIVILTVLALAASTAAVFAIRLQREAVRQRDLATYNRILAEADRLRDTNTSLSAQLTLAAHRMRPGDETRTRLLTSQHSVLSSALTGHKVTVRAAAFSPDGRLLVSAGEDGTILFWARPPTGEPVALGRPLAAHTDAVTSVAFSPDGRLLASTGFDNTVRLWNVADPANPSRAGEMLGPVGNVSSVAFSPDGRTLAGGTTGVVLLWNVADPGRVRLAGYMLTGDKDHVWSVAFSPDGDKLASGALDGTVRLWKVADRAKPTPLGRPLRNHEGYVFSVAFSPDGSVLASAGEDRTVRLWKVADRGTPTPLGQPLIGHSDTVNSVAFSPDGYTIASGGYDGTIRLWNVADPARLSPRGQPLAGHSDTVHAVVFSPDGHTLASGGADASVRLWRLSRSEIIDRTKSVSSAAFRRDGRVLATANYDNSVRLWDVADPARVRLLGKPLTGHTSGVQSVAFSPDGRTLASGGLDNQARLWDVTDPAKAVPLGKPLAGHSSSVNSVAFSPDGRVLVTGSGDSTLRVWDVGDPAEPVLLGKPIAEQKDGIIAVAFNPKSRVLASSSLGRTVWLWDLADPARPVALGRPLLSDTNHSLAITFSPDGRVLAGADRSIRLWNVADPANPVLLGQNLTGHTHAVRSVAFSPDMRMLASAGADRSIQLWDVADPARPRPVGQPLTGHTNHVSAVAFTPDGRTMVSSSDDRSFRLWTLDLDQVIGRVCALTGNALTPTVWRRYVGTDHEYDPPCS